MPTYDPSLGTSVHSERERERLAAKLGLADIRDWNSKESIERDAKRHAEERRKADTEYMDPLLNEAMDYIERDEEIPRELEHRMEEERDRAIERRDEQIARERQEIEDRNQERYEREQWERNRR